jgi:ferric-dicitrate binding protein FerR (iron transport regulator)
MKAKAMATCPRLFEVEALRDGRLTGAEVTRFQSHVRTCAACAQEMRALAELGDALRSIPPSPEAHELHVRRERTRLLAAFDASLVPAPGRSRPKLWLGAVAVLVLIMALLALRLRPSPPVTPVAASLESVKVQAAETTKWSRRAENQLETITLETGTLSIRVDHRSPHRRLLVLLPDGELEDIGTTFSVSAAAGQTTRVTVQDGAVILRLRGAPALTLRAGDSWIPAPAPATTTSSASPAPARPVLAVPSAKPAASAGPPKPAASVAPAPTIAAPRATSALVAVPAAAHRPDPAADFRTAMSAFTGGDNARASSLFDTFLSQHPRDSRAEDAAYLRVLALQRAGNLGATKRAAAEYLKRYPHGFRHAEVERLSR